MKLGRIGYPSIRYGKGLELCSVNKIPSRRRMLIDLIEPHLTARKYENNGELKAW